MSFTELKESVPALTDAQLGELAACINAVRTERDPKWLARMAELNKTCDEMKAGRAYGEEEVLRIHNALADQGR